MEVKIKLDLFEGPLDLLLHLIEKSEVDIYDVPIAQITDQYVDIIAEAQTRSLDIASEFLVMAATLLAMKSRMLLPTIEKSDEETLLLEEWSDPREELVERLLEYKKYKILGDVLAKNELEKQQLHSRLPIDPSPYQKPQNPLQNVKPDDLFHVFIKLLKTEKPAEPVEKVVREEISVSDRMKEIEHLLMEREKISFQLLLPLERRSKEQIITTFLAILELIKCKQITCYQDDLFLDIQIYPYQEGVLISG